MADEPPGYDNGGWLATGYSQVYNGHNVRDRERGAAVSFDSIEGIAFRYSEWLYGEGLIREGTATDKRSHEDLATEFAAHEADRSEQ